MTVCMHLCRGNFAGAWIAEGGYEPIAELLFNEIGVDGYFLEYNSPRAGDFSPLRFLPKGKIAVLELVTTKSPKMEAKDELKRRVEEASRYAPIEQLALSPQCGFSSGIGGQAMTVGRDQEAYARSRDRSRGVGIGLIGDQFADFSAASRQIASRIEMIAGPRKRRISPKDSNSPKIPSRTQRKGSRVVLPISIGRTK